MHIWHGQYKVKIHDKDKQRKEYMNNNNKGKLNRGQYLRQSEWERSKKVKTTVYTTLSYHLQVRIIIKTKII